MIRAAYCVATVLLSLQLAASPAATRVLFTIVTPEHADSARVTAEAQKLASLLDVQSVRGSGEVFAPCAAFAETRKVERCVADLLADPARRAALAGSFTRRGVDGQAIVVLGETAEGLLTGALFCLTRDGSVEGSGITLEPIARDGRFLPRAEAAASRYYLVHHFPDAAVRAGFAVERPRVTLTREENGGTFAVHGEGVIDAEP